MTIQISGYDVLIDDEDYGRVMAMGKWHIRGKTTKFGPYFAHSDYRPKMFTIPLHRFIVNCPCNLLVDHINGNALDNRKCNLRICNYSENAQNRKKASGRLSQYKGVTRNRNRWQAQICANGRRMYLGCFSTEIEAHEAYCKAAQIYHGEFMRLA